MGSVVQSLRGQLGLLGQQARNRERFQQIRPPQERVGGAEPPRLRLRGVRGPQRRRRRRPRLGRNALLRDQGQGGDVQRQVQTRRRPKGAHEILQGSATAVVFSPRLRPTPSPATHLILHRHTQLQLHPPSVVTALLNFNRATTHQLHFTT